MSRKRPGWARNSGRRSSSGSSLVILGRLAQHKVFNSLKRQYRYSGGHTLDDNEPNIIRQFSIAPPATKGKNIRPGRPGHDLLDDGKPEAGNRTGHNGFGCRGVGSACPRPWRWGTVPPKA